MNRVSQCAAAALLAVSFMPDPATAGAWLQEEGRGILINNAVYYHADSYFDLDGNRRAQGDFDKLEWNPYLEYGLRSNLTVGINTALQWVESDLFHNGNSADNTGIGDTELFARTKLWEENGAVVSLQPLVKFPAAYREDGLPRSGSEHWDAELRVLGGYGFGYAGQNHYVSGELAYRKRFGAPRDQLRFDTTLGIGVTEKLQILGQAFTTWRINPPDMSSFTQSGADDYSVVKLQLSGVYALEHGWSLQAGGFSDVWGRNSGKGRGVLFSVWKAF